jgi:hypothetical protein
VSEVLTDRGSSVAKGLEAVFAIARFGLFAWALSDRIGWRDAFAVSFAFVLVVQAIRGKK